MSDAEDRAIAREVAEQEFDDWVTDWQNRILEHAPDWLDQDYDQFELIQIYVTWLEEIARTAAGVVLTSHPRITEEMVVLQWWNALKTALAEHP